MGRYRSIIPAETREGEFAKGGTGGFSAFESFERQTTPQDEARLRELRKLYRGKHWSMVEEYTDALIRKGCTRKYVNRLVAMAGHGIKV